MPLTVQLPSQTLFVGALATGGVYVPAAQPPASPFTFTMAAGATSLNCTVTGNTLVTCIPTGGSLPGGVSGTLTVFAKVQPSTVAGTVLSATANITPPGPNATSVATITVAGVADLSVTNVDTPDPLIAGGNITYTITVTNGGPSVATGVGISFPLDANTTFVSSVGPPCMTPAVGTTGTVTCTVAADLAPLGQVVLTVIANVNPAFSGIANATATVCDGNRSDTGNNSAIASTTVQPLTFPVTGAVPYGNGTIYCPSPVQFGTTTTCTLTPVTGATVASVSGCGGLPGSSLTYTTGPITAACTVTASFVPPPIPTLGEAMLLLLGLLLAGAGVLQLRRKT
ncbi:MAG: IPTL-CTERM sorting domain-containing protein [Betaproteobacteria bacterium]|nr:IPTL-CTERM sorting domain-containing protein [Betaproteobacteria bacterium]